MEDNKSENQSAKESGTVSPPVNPVADPKPVVDPKLVAEPQAAANVKKETSKAGQFFRSLLIWLGVIAVAFLAGVGTYHFTRYTPLKKSMDEAQSALTEANSKLSTLTAEKQKADATISTLQGKLATANAHVDILQLLADANGARLALIAKDVEGAKTALGNSTETLNRVIPLLTKVNQNLAQSMSQRLGLILSELDRDSKSAQVDLELLTKDLLTAEEALSK
jgi:hypothetical protein